MTTIAANHNLLQTVPIARQALVRADGTTVGFELFNRSRAHSSHTVDSDAALAFTMLSHVEQSIFASQHLLFLNCTHETLAGDHLALLLMHHVVLEIQSLGHAADHEVHIRLPALRALRNQGFLLAFDHSVLENAYAPWLPLADFIKIDLSVLPPDRVVLLMQYARRHSSASLVADKIETTAQLQLAHDHKADLLQGFAVARPTLSIFNIMMPTLAQVRQLQAQPTRFQTASYIEQHAVLAYNLMRLIRSLRLDASNPCLAVDEMLQSLSPQQLGHWIGLMRSVAQSPYAEAAQNQQVVAKAHYIVAQSSKTDHPIPFAAALAAVLTRDTPAISALHLPEQVQQTLQTMAGPLTAYLQQSQAAAISPAAAPAIASR